MAQDISLSDLKEKFTTVQSIDQSLKEKKIRLDSEMVAVERERQAKLAEVLEQVGATTYEQAVQIVQTMKADMETETRALNTELSAYLDTYGESSEGDS